MRSLTRRHALIYLAGIPLLSVISRKAFGAATFDGAIQPRLVVIHLRGALDGLAAVPPYADPDYRQLRGALALPRPGQRRGVIDLDGCFGLHPGLAPLQAFYAAGEMLVFPAVAGPRRTYAHDIGQALLQTGTTQPGEGDQPVGWLDRTAALLGCGESAYRPSGENCVNPARLGLLADLCYGPFSIERFLTGHEAGHEARGDLIPAFEDQAAAFAVTARDVGTRFAADDQHRLALIESHGWDTHADQGSGDGRLAIALAGLADGISALAAASGDAWRSTAVLVVTEFGRTIRMNRMGGTDHGTGTAAFLLGGAVAGGRVIGRWPGLATEKLYHGRDLMPVTDLHAVVKAVLIDHLAIPPATVDRLILPQSGQTPSLQGLFRTAIS